MAVVAELPEDGLRLALRAGDLPLLLDLARPRLLLLLLDLDVERLDFLDTDL